MFIGVGDAVVLNIVGICRVLPMMSMRRAYPYSPRGVVLWCIHNTRMSWFSVRDSIRKSRGIVGSSYVMVPALKCVMTCEYGKGPLWG